MACFVNSTTHNNVFHSLDNLELSLGEFCDLIQDEADAGILGGDTGAAGWAGCHGNHTTGQAPAWSAHCDGALVHSNVQKQHGGQISSSSLLSDSEMFIKSERTAANTPGSWPLSANTGMPLGQSCNRLPDLQTRHSDAATNEMHLLAGMAGCEGSGSPTLVSAASMQHLPPNSHLNAPLHPVLCHTNSLSMEEDEFDAISRPPVSHSSVEKQRRDRLNSLIEKLSTIVPPSDERYVAAGSGARRPKHVVLSDAIRTLRAFQDHMRSCTTPGSSSARNATKTPAPVEQQFLAPPPPPLTTTTAATTRPKPINTGSLLDFPLPLDIPATATGVMVEAPPGSSVWRLRVTCRDRAGLLADVAVALRSLPVNVTAASVTTTLEGKAQQVFELQLLDATLAPEEVQCAINAALYAHLLSGSGAPSPSAPTPAGTPTEQLNNHLPAKRARLV